VGAEHGICGGSGVSEIPARWNPRLAAGSGVGCWTRSAAARWELGAIRGGVLVVGATARWELGEINASRAGRGRGCKLGVGSAAGRSTAVRAGARQFHLLVDADTKYLIE
jgi:hypothetical protein